MDGLSESHRVSQEQGSGARDTGAFPCPAGFLLLPATVLLPSRVRRKPRAGFVQEGIPTQGETRTCEPKAGVSHLLLAVGPGAELEEGQDGRQPQVWEGIREWDRGRHRLKRQR